MGLRENPMQQQVAERLTCLKGSVCVATGINCQYPYYYLEANYFFAKENLV